MAGAKLREKGWHLSDEGIEQCKQNGKEDVDSLIKTALDTDLREVGAGWLPEELSRGRADYVEGPGIVQLQKIRNVSAPKDNEDSQAAPRLMKLSLTDGQTTCSAIETEVLRDINLNTPPGSKIKLKSTIDIEHGFLLLNNKNTQVLGGRVEKLVETWELKKKLAQQSRVMTGTEGGPPLFVPFGHKIDNSQIKNPRRDNFKSLETNKVEKKKEDDEFEQQRKATIAEALQAKEDGMAKKFGGQKQATSDHDIARITEMGFRADEAGTALRMHNGNVQHAIDYLLTRKKPGGPNRQSSYEGDRGDRGRGRRDRRDDDNGPPGRGRRGRGGDSEEAVDGVPSKPSAPATLFDFLTTKFPANESKGSGKEDKDSSSHSSSSSKFTERNSQSQYNESRDRPKSAYNVNIEPTFNQSNRPKPQQSIPPRFVNKSKQDSGQSYSKGQQGRYRDDKPDRSRDDRPRTSPNDRNYENRNYENRSYNDKPYNDKPYNERNYNDRNYNSDRNYNDRNYNDRDRNKGYNNDRRNNDYGESHGNRDTRGDRGQNYNRNNSNNNNSNNNNNNNSSSSDYSQRNNTKSASASAKSNPPEKKGPRENKENQETVPYDNKKSSNRTQVEVSSASAKSRNFQKGQNDRTEQSSTVKSSGTRQDNNTKTVNVVQQNTYRNDRSQNNSQNYVPNGNYTNQQQRFSYGGPPVTSTGYMYPETQMLPFGLKMGDKVMAKYWEDGGFYEAVIDYYAPNLPTCMVIFVDYGNCEEVRLSDIRPILPQMPMGQHPGPMMQPDMSIPPPGVFFSAPPPTMPTGMDGGHNAINSMEFRRGGGGAAYNRKEGRPAQQLYQPPSQRR